MKTEVPKIYKYGFTLSELELRRLAQTCQDHMLKQCTTEHINVLLTATLLDGSVIETSVIDEILSLENAGSRQIKKVSLEYSDKKELADCQISVIFQNADMNPESWVSINSSVVGKTRDWAFLAAADIDERIKRVTRVSPSFVINNRQFYIVPMVISLALMLFLLPPSPSSSFAADKLEEAYQSGLIKDPIQE